jgi:flagellar biosynthesis/type III secretory pathway chaperone
VNRSVADLAAALDGVAMAMDEEVEAVRSGQAGQLSTAADRKRVAIEAVAPILQRSPDVASAATPAGRARLIQATRRMQAAAARNAVVLQGALEGTRRLFSCLVDAAQAASSTGTYGPDGSVRRAEETVGTIRRSA